MKILLIGIFFPPKNVSASWRLYSFAQAWSDMGHEVDVLTIPQSHELTETHESFDVHYVDLCFSFETLKNIKRKIFSSSKNSNSKNQNDSTRAIPSWLSRRGFGTSTRMPDVFDLWIPSAIKWAKKQDKHWDVVLSSFGPYAPHLIGQKLKLLDKASFWVADFRDLWTENHIFTGFPLFKDFERFLENRVFQEADLVSIVSSPLKDIMQRKYPETSCIAIENGYMEEDFVQQNDKSPFQSDALNIVYTGTIYPEKRDPSPLFQALSELQKTGKDISFFQFHFYGPNLENLEPAIKKYQVQSLVHCYGQVSKKESIRAQNHADLLLFLESKEKYVDGVLTGKLFEYLKNPSTILAIGIDNETLAGKIIEQANSGFALGHNVDAIKKFLLEFDKNNKPLKDQNYISQFNRINIAQRFMAQITSSMGYRK